MEITKENNSFWSIIEIGLKRKISDHIKNILRFDFNDI